MLLELKSTRRKHYTSGIFTLIVSFYQIKQLMKVDVQYKNSTDFSLIKFITDCLNLEMVAVTYSSYCPMSNLDAVSKTFIKTLFAHCHIINSLFDKLFCVNNFPRFSLKRRKILIIKAIIPSWSLLHTFTNAQL